MEPKPYILQETNWKTVKETNYQVAVLPWGATEAHNYHLPFGTDNIQNEHVAAEAARLAWGQDAKVVVLPNMPFGANCQQVDIKLTINLNPSTQHLVLHDVIDSLDQQGVKKLVILNGHGGNEFKQMIRELSMDFPDMFICQVHWFLVEPDWGKYFEDVGDHAGEMETSIMMHIAPDWVLPLDMAGDGTAKKLTFEGRQEGWLWAPRQWTKVTKDTGIGNPKAANADKGKAYLDIVTARIADFLIGLAVTDVEDVYKD
jgi:creatinine amidohydrolase